MREEGLRLAIEAAGGIGALARGLAIRQPSVSAWTRVPAERVLAIETLTGVARDQLRPDLYGPAALETQNVDEIERARAGYYLLLAKLLRSAPDAKFLAEIAALTGDGTPLGMAVIELAEAAGRSTAKDAANEFFALFIGVGRGEILPYASFYLTGFLHERPLARVRQDLDRLGIERAEQNFDPEDHLGLLFEVMGGFARGSFEADLATQQAFFSAHIASWAGRAFDDLGVASSAKFYKAVARLGREFVDLERDAFEIETPREARTAPHGAAYEING